jgi:hypothetical protein
MKYYTTKAKSAFIKQEFVPEGSQRKGPKQA